jgi:integrase/recombinase XerD
MIVCLDANIMIYLVEQNPLWESKASARIAACRAAGDEIVVSDAARLDCLVGPLQTGSDPDLASYTAFFAGVGPQMLPVTASVDTRRAVRLRDRAVVTTLAYTAVRGGAVAKHRVGDFQHEGRQYVLRFQEKCGKSREIPMRHDLEDPVVAYVSAARIGGAAKHTPLFRTPNGRTRTLSGAAMTSKRIRDLVKRRLKVTGLPSKLSLHSFRVTAITDLLTQGVPLGDVQYLPGHAEPRTMGLYDRRQKNVTRNIGERIST